MWTWCESVHVCGRGVCVCTCVDVVCECACVWMCVDVCGCVWMCVDVGCKCGTDNCLSHSFLQGRSLSFKTFFLWILISIYQGNSCLMYVLSILMCSCPAPLPAPLPAPHSAPPFTPRQRDHVWFLPAPPRRVPPCGGHLLHCAGGHRAGDGGAHHSHLALAHGGRRAG